MFRTVLDTKDPSFRSKLTQWMRQNRAVTRDGAVTQRVEEILSDVRERGDLAVLEWTKTLDKLSVPSAMELELPIEEVWEAVETTDPEVLEAIEHAHERIEAFHQALVPSDKFPFGEDGPAYQRSVPLRRVGVYVPGGRAAYPSSVLMCVTPAKVAGVEEVVMVTPAPNGKVPRPVLAAAAIAGVDRVFTIGGAQAVGALAFGTEMIPAVDKIVGPGNQYVAEAKRQVFGTVGIDMIAGPSEVLVALLDPTLHKMAAIDLLAQAEHDPSAVPMLLVSCASDLESVCDAIEEELKDLPRADLARQSLNEQGLALIVSDHDLWPSLCNELASEHLELLGSDEAAQAMASSIDVAGALFVGSHSPEALGDYAAGPDHVLPTAGTARFASPLGPEDFRRRMSVLQFSQKECASLRDTVRVLARAEGLEAHARSIEARPDEPNEP